MTKINQKVAAQYATGVGVATGAVAVAVKTATAVFSPVATAVARVSPMLARVGGALVSTPVLVAGTAVGGTYGGIKSIMEGNTAEKVAWDSVKGAASLGTNLVHDAMVGTAHAMQPDRSMKELASAPVAQLRDGIILAADRSSPGDEQFRATKQAEKLVKKSEQLDKQSTKLLDRADRKLEKAGIETPPPKPLPSVTERINNLLGVQLFENGKPVETPQDRQRTEITKKVQTYQDELKKELSRGGTGPKADSIEAKLRTANSDLATVTQQQAHTPTPFMAGVEGALPIAAMLMGFNRGANIAGHAVEEAAVAGRVVVARVERMAADAGKLTAKNPNGVLAGTPAGDKIAGMVESSKTQVTAALGKPGAGAYMVPAVNAAAAAPGIAVAVYSDNHAVKTAGRVEAGFEIGQAVGGAKTLLLAKAAQISAGAMSKLYAAATRLEREATVGSASVARANNARKVANATGKAGVAVARNSERVAGAQVLSTQALRKAEVARIMGQNSVAKTAAKGEAGVAVAKIEAGAQVGVAKVEGAMKIERAAITAKGANSKLIENGQRGTAPYKDTWITKNGVVKHRIDKSVRKAATRPEAIKLIAQ